MKRLWIVSAIIFILGFIPYERKFTDYIHLTSFLIILAPILISAIRNFRDHPFSVDLLMSIAAIAGAFIGSFGEATAVLLVYQVAEYLEDYIVDKVIAATKRVVKLIPQKVLVRRNGLVQEVKVEDVKLNDIVIVKPGDRIPVDGVVIDGKSFLDQSTITGESIPVLKGVGDEVISGSLNLEGSLEIKVTKPFKDSTLNKIVELVIKAKDRKARIESFIYRFSKYYTPFMLVLALSIALIPPILFKEEFIKWIYRALIALIIACPSAFIISTPITILLGLTRAMWSGILVKGGRYFEELNSVKAIIFDKTGTLTQGNLKVSKVIPLNSLSEDEILKVACEAEVKSTHPIAKAIVDEAINRGIKPTYSLNIVTFAGEGIICDEYSIGSLKFLKKRGVITSFGEEHEGSVVGIAKGNRLIGLILLEDKIREESKHVVLSLKRDGLEIFLLSGDNERNVKDIANKLNIRNYYSGLLPEDKVRIANELRSKFGSVAMVGDGINDAPVLASSNVGIAIGGNDLALEASDVALIGSNLKAIPYLLKLSRKVMIKVKLNFLLALSFKVFMIILGVLGFLPLWLAVLGDDGITLLLVLNSLSLLKFKLN